jgi:hypothetical protein
VPTCTQQNTVSASVWVYGYLDQSGSGVSASGIAVSPGGGAPVSGGPQPPPATSCAAGSPVPGYYSASFGTSGSSCTSGSEYYTVTYSCASCTAYC